MAKFRVPDTGAPRPPKSPKLPGQSQPWDKLGPDPLKWLKLIIKKNILIPMVKILKNLNSILRVEL